MWHNITFPNVFLFFSKRKNTPATKAVVKEEKKVEPNYYDFLLEVEKGKAKNNQILADMNIQFELNRSTVNSFSAWNSFDWMPIPFSISCIIYDKETAKFKNQEDINKYKAEVFDRLKEEGIEKAGDIPLSLEEIERIESNPWEYTIFTRCELIKRKNKLNNERKRK